MDKGYRERGNAQLVARNIENGSRSMLLGMALGPWMRLLDGGWTGQKGTRDEFA